MGVTENIMAGKSAKDLVAEAMSEVETLSGDEAAKLVGDPDVVFVDVREGEELQKTGKLPGAVHVPRTMRNIRQNLFFAFIYNALGVPVAAGVLYPVLGITLNPIIAAAAMSLSSVSVVANALRLRAARL